MNEQLEKQLANIVEKSIVLAEKTGEFAIEQAPDLLRQFYLWHISKNCFYSFISVMIGVVIFKFIKSLGSDNEKYEYGELCPVYFGKYYDMDNRFVMYILGGIGFISTSTFLILSLLDLLYICIAPKLYLIDYFVK